MSRLWSAIQAHYPADRLYLRLQVVLIEARKGTRNVLPILSRGRRVEPRCDAPPRSVVVPSLLPPYPTIDSIVPP